MTLFELLGLLRKHIVLVIVLTLLGGAGTFGVSMLLPNEYTASTTMYVLSRNESAEDPSITQSDLSAGQMLTNDVATLIKSARVSKDVAQKVGLDNLNGYKLNVNSSSTTRVITLGVTGKDPEMAARIANAIVDEVSMVASQVMQIQSVNAIDSASTPTTPSGPRRLLFSAVGAMAGFFLAVAIVVIQDMLDTRVRSGEEAEEIVGVPVVGHFPAVES